MCTGRSGVRGRARWCWAERAGAERSGGFNCWFRAAIREELEKERQALGNAAFFAKYAPTAEERQLRKEQLRKERDEVSFIAHVLEQRIVDIECDAVWEGDAAADESEARPTKAARVA